VRHVRRALSVVPETWLGKGQLLYLAFLWFVTLMSFAHELSAMNPVGWVLQWGVTINALLCTYLVMGAAAPAAAEIAPAGPAYAGWLRRSVALGLLSAVGCSFGGWALKRRLFGDAFAPHFYMNHIRFGPNNTNDRR